MMKKTFKDLKIGDKVFLDFHAYFICNIVIKNGHLSIQVSGMKDTILKPWLNWHYIPLNHLNATKLKLRGIWLFCSRKAYKKYMYEFIDKQIEL